MNILILTQKLMTSDVSGLAKRLYPFLKELKKMGHNITIISFYENDEEIENLAQCNEYYDKIIPVKYNRKIAYLRMLKALITHKPFKLEFVNTLKMKTTLKKELQENHYDVLYAHYYKMSTFLVPYKKYTRIVDLCDAFAIRYDKELALEKNPLKRFFIKQERQRMYNFEKKCIYTFNKCLYISETDRNYMAKTEYEKSKTDVVLNGVDTDYFAPQNNTFNKYEINYIGLMSYVANHDAVVYFIKNIYPLIKKQIENVTFKVIGANPRPELINIAKQDKSIIVTGFVQDIREEIGSSCLSVAPVRIGAGIQNKILEAMSMGVPVVTTPFGAEGITNNEDVLLIANNEEQFANKVCKLLLDKNLRSQYAQKGREYCQQEFSWRAHSQRLSDILCNEYKKKQEK